MCDGSNRVRMRALIEPALSREDYGSAVRVENGYPSIAIDGLCSYIIGGGWTEDASGRDRGWRSGRLDPTVEARLSSVLDLTALDRLQDCTLGGANFDLASRVLIAANSRARCEGGDGPRFEDAWRTIADTAADLWSHGTPLSGPIRASATSAWSTSRPYQWPLTTALSTFIRDADESTQAGPNVAGTSRLVEGADAAVLRALREQFLSDREATPGLFLGGMAVSDGVTTATLYMRDALPYEDNDGLLQFSDR